jgi:hypothetical protein
MEQVRIAGRMRKYINSAMMRNTAVGLSPHLTVNVPCIDEESGEQRVDLDISGKNITQKVIVTDVNKHLSYKAERIKKWMSREGLEDERKWMTDTKSTLGESLLSPFCQDTHRIREGPTGAGDTRGCGRGDWDGAPAVLASAQSGLCRLEGN